MAADLQVASWATRVEVALERALPAPELTPSRLHQAMRHAVLGGGKRLRAQLVYAAGHVCGANDSTLDAPAVAVELVHAFSLVHDDLPAMDDDALRRGKPTVHIAFDEATAILAGDALQALAFQVVATAPMAADARVALITTLAQACGSLGMCGGQQMDMDATGSSATRMGRDTTLATLQTLHAMKTGALIRASVAMGAGVGNADADLLGRLDAFACDLGLAFQIRDDILDVEADGMQLGKTAGKDAAQDKLTYPAVLGLAGSKSLLEELGEKMRDTLAPLGSRADALLALAQFAVARAH